MFLHDLHKIQQPCASEKQEHLFPFVLICILYSQPLFHCSVTLSSIPTKRSSHGSKGRRGVGEVCGNEFWTVWWAGKNSPSEFCDCFLSFRTCVWSCIVVMKVDCGNIFMKSDSTGTFLQGFKSLMCRSQLNGLKRGIMSTKITPYATQKTVARATRVTEFRLDFLKTCSS
jgi:hypothetical protein